MNRFSNERRDAQQGMRAHHPFVQSIMTSKIIEVSILRDGGMCAIPVPFDPKAVFGKVRAPVKVTVKGYTFRSTIARMGGQTFIPLRKSNREAAAVEGGERVRVRITADDDPRVVDVPSDLSKALKAQPGLWRQWGQLSYTNQRECVESVVGAKRAATRERRIGKAVEFVSGRARVGQTRQRCTHVALLRGINVGGANKVPMAELRAICAEIGCGAVRTYIQSGNVVFESSLSAASLENRLEAAIAKAFGVSVPVIVRAASRWSLYVKGNPFFREAETQGNRVLLCLSKQVPTATAASDLQQRATQGERVAKRGDAIWIHYSNGIARSKLSPTVLDRYVESPVTTRNWRTVLKLDELAKRINGAYRQ